MLGSTARGFTLIEMLVVIAMVAVLSALAAPSVRDFMVRSAMSSAAGEFQASVLRARNEAANKNICTTMCLSTTTNADAPSCDTKDENDWQKGWIIFLNLDCDSSLNSPKKSNDVFFVRQDGDPNILIQSQSSPAVRKISFNSRGYNTLGSATELNLIYQTSNNINTKKYGVNICLDALGRTGLIPGNNSCSNYK